MTRAQQTFAGIQAGKRPAARAGRVWALLCGAALLAGAAPAQAREVCDGIPALAGAGPLTMALVAPGVARSYFYRGMADAGRPTGGDARVARPAGTSLDATTCPAFSDACREKAFVVAGDNLIISVLRGDFVCGYFVAPRQRGKDTFQEVVRSGWLIAANLAPGAAAAPPVWVGRWERAEATITITSGAASGEVKVKGEATFGALDPERVKRGGVNLGQIAGAVRPVDGSLSFAMGASGSIPVAKAGEYDCKVWMRRVGPWLVVDDNSQCGGANVSFRGLYARSN